MGKHRSGRTELSCGLHVEDEFVLTRIRNRAKSIDDPAKRDQFFWTIIIKMICKERAYKTVMDQIGVCVDTNVDLFDDEDLSVKE